MMEDHAIYPEYTKDSVYEELVLLVENAGVVIEYVSKIDETVGGAQGADIGKPVIQMKTGYDYGSNQYAAFVLAHEMAHILTDAFYGEDSQALYSDASHVRQFMEADADKVGAALYSLAERTAVWKAEAKFCPEVEHE